MNNQGGMRLENYVVYPDGRIWSDYKKDFLVPQDNGIGYMKVLMRLNGKPTNMYVHRLVATAFIPKPFGLNEVNHIDGNKKNNNVSNLEWCTCKYNINYGTKIQRQRETLIRKNKERKVRNEVN